MWGTVRLDAYLMSQNLRCEPLAGDLAEDPTPGGSVLFFSPSPACLMRPPRLPEVVRGLYGKASIDSPSGNTVPL